MYYYSLEQSRRQPSGTVSLLGFFNSEMYFLWASYSIQKKGLVHILWR